MNAASSFDFAIGRFPVRVHWSFLLISVLIGLDMRNPILTISWVVIVFVSLLVHELGHAMVAESYGMFPSIMLYSMGGLTIPGRTRTLSHLQEIFLSLAGPFAGFLLGGVIYFISLLVPGQGLLFRVILSQCLWVNFGWGVLNLIPMLPLDGGHVMRNLWQWAGHPYDERTPFIISIGTGVLAVLGALAFGQIFMALLAAWLTYNNFNNLRGGRSINY